MKEATKKNLEKTVVKARNYTDNFYAFLVEGIDILSTSQKYRSLESRYRALDNAKHKEMFDRMKQYRALKRLKRRGWIEIRGKGKDVEYQLTNNGRIEALNYQMAKVEENLPNNMHCFVIYDFPVGANKARDKFRLYLKRSGLTKRQDSVWCTNKNVICLLTAVIRELGIEKWVEVIIGSTVV